MQYASGSDTENARWKSVKCQIIQAEGSSGCSEATGNPTRKLTAPWCPAQLHCCSCSCCVDECLSCSHISVALDLIRGLGDKDILTSCHDIGWNHTDCARTQQWIPFRAWTCCQVLEDDRHGQVCDTGPAAGGQINVLAFRMAKTVQTGSGGLLGAPRC